MNAPSVSIAGWKLLCCHGTCFREQNLLTAPLLLGVVTIQCELQSFHHSCLFSAAQKADHDTWTFEAGTGWPLFFVVGLSDDKGVLTHAVMRRSSAAAPTPQKPPVVEPQARAT